MEVYISKQGDVQKVILTTIYAVIVPTTFKIDLNSDMEAAEDLLAGYLDIDDCSSDSDSIRFGNQDLFKKETIQ